MDKVSTLYSYVGESSWKTNSEVGGMDSIKASIAQKIFNENSGEVCLHFLQIEMMTVHPDLHNFEVVFQSSWGLFPTGKWKHFSGFVY